MLFPIQNRLRMHLHFLWTLYVRSMNAHFKYESYFVINLVLNYFFFLSSNGITVLCSMKLYWISRRLSRKINCLQSDRNEHNIRPIECYLIWLLVCRLQLSLTLFRIDTWNIFVGIFIASMQLYRPFLKQKFPANQPVTQCICRPTL